MTKNFDAFLEKILEDVGYGDAFGPASDGPYDTSDFRTPFSMGTIRRRKKKKKSRKRKKKK